MSELSSNEDIFLVVESLQHKQKAGSTKLPAIVILDELLNCLKSHLDSLGSHLNYI